MVGAGPLFRLKAPTGVVGVLRVIEGDKSGTRLFETRPQA